MKQHGGRQSDMVYDEAKRSIATDRLLLRPFREADAERVAELCSNDRLYRSLLSLPPVSYTHLDVYKRQGKGRYDAAGGFPSGRRGDQACFRDGRGVVSVPRWLSCRGRRRGRDSRRNGRDACERGRPRRQRARRDVYKRQRMRTSKRGSA